MTGVKQPKDEGTPGLSAAQLVGEVRSRYPRPEWHCEAEVTLANRRLDVVAFNLWGARGYRIVGFEIKVSRGDWLRELAAFEKSAEWHAVVDAFYVVTPGGLVKPEELPAGWGLLELRGSRMFTKVQAAARAPRPDLPREISARFLGRVLEQLEQTRREASVGVRREIREELEASIEQRLRDEFGERLSAADAAAAELEALREALGAGYYDTPKELQALVQLARTMDRQLVGRGRQLASGLHREAGELTRIAERVSSLLEATNPPAAEVAHGG